LPAAWDAKKSTTPSLSEVEPVQRKSERLEGLGEHEPERKDEDVQVLIAQRRPRILRPLRE
jgi:hypothetical protein